MPIVEKMVRKALVASLILGYSAVLLAQQQRPSFSGTWIIQPPNKAAGVETVVKQDDKTITVTNPGRTLTHVLDGAERKQTMASRIGDIVMLTKAAWEGGTIVITTSTSYPNNIRTVEKETWSIDAQGQLVIDFTETAAGQAPRVLKVVHKKKG